MNGSVNGSASGTTTDPVYGLLRLGNLDLALPLSALREVVPRPDELSALPVVATGLVGAMGLRSLVLPVVDLRPVLELTDEPPAEQVVVVVAHEQRVVGLVVDEVRGVTRVPDADLLPFATVEGRLLVSHAFQHQDGAVPVSVLDAGELLALPGVPTVAEAAVAAGDVDGTDGTGGGPGTTAGDPTRSLTLVRCGTQVLALGVDAIHTTVPLPEILPSLLAGGDCLGSTAHAGRDVAVVDPLALLGLPPMSAEDIGAGVVLDLGAGLVVLAVSELVELRAAGAGILRVPGLAAHRPELVLGVVELDEGACLVLDGDGLKADRTLLALASVNTDLAVAQAGDRAAEATVAGGPAYVTYTAGLALASPLDQVGEILPFPAALTPSAAEHVLGLVVHRGSVVPVVCLSTLLGHPPLARAAASCLLLVGTGEEQVAFAVDALGAIEPLVWTDPEHRGRGRSDELAEDLSRAAHLAPLVRLAGGDRLVPALDLPALAAALGSLGSAGAAGDRPVAAPAA